MPTATVVKKDPQYTQLIKEAKEHEAFINRIKAQVSQEADNIDQPIPLFQQLQQLS